MTKTGAVLPFSVEWMAICCLCRCACAAPDAYGVGSDESDPMAHLGPIPIRSGIEMRGGRIWDSEGSNGNSEWILSVRFSLARCANGSNNTLS